MAAVQEEFPDGPPPCDCVVEELQGELLSFTNNGVHATCDCFDSDPYRGGFFVPWGSHAGAQNCL